MIRLAFMCDTARVIGASDEATNAKRFEVLPPALEGVMGQLYQTRNAVIAGEPSLTGMRSPSFASATKFVLTRDPDFTAPDDLPDAVAVSDADELAQRYKDSDEELLVIGGRTVFRLFLPYASRIDIAETDKLVPGDVVFDEWDNGDFKIASEDQWEGGHTLHLVLSV